MLRVVIDDDRRRFAMMMIDRWLRLQDLRGRRFLARRSGGNRAIDRQVLAIEGRQE